MAKARRARVNELRKLVERRYRTTFWGGKYLVSPKLVSEAFGDGKRLIHMTPLNTRPQYYVVRVDSKCDTTSDEFRDQLDAIYDAIDDQFGNTSCESMEDEPWPAHNDNCGHCWGKMEWPTVKAKRK
jgi:hypothetical protein